MSGLSFLIEHWLILLTVWLVVLVLCFLPFSSISSVEGVNTLSDAAHLPLFGLLAAGILFAFYIRDNKVLRSEHYLIAGVVSVILAALVELLQPLVGRDSSFVDFVNGGIGIILALCGVLVLTQQKSLVSLLSYGTALLLGIAIVLTPPFEQYRAELRQAERFPILSTFEDPREVLLWFSQTESGRQRTNLTISSSERHEGTNSLQVQFGSGSWPGVTHYPPASSWHGLRFLKFAVWTTADNFPLIIRIDDSGDVTTVNKRFNKQLKLKKGWNLVEIDLEQIKLSPTARQLNLDKIRRIILFVPGSHSRSTIYLDDFRLE